MKTILPKNLHTRRLLLGAQTLSVCCLIAAAGRAQTIKWGLTLTNIYNPTPTTVLTNTDGSISITTGGGDTYSAPDSFAYAYQQVTGDFDIRVRVMNVTCSNPGEQVSPKGSLMVRASLNPGSYDFMINALPLSTTRLGQIESIGRLNLATDTDDLPGRNLTYGSFSNNGNSKYGGDTTDNNYCTYPDVWLRIQRKGFKLMSYFASDYTEDIPSGSNPGSTNGWQLLCVAPTTTNFPATVYIGLSTVAHNNLTNDSADTVTATYASYGPTPFPASIPSTNGVAVGSSEMPGAFPNNRVLAVNWDVSLPANGLGYPGDTLQSAQGAASEIIWNNGGYTSVSRDILADINSESPQGFAAARYQCSGFDFVISPQNPTLAQQNLGPYTNPNRDRYATGSAAVPACLAYAHSPNYGFVMSSVHKNGASWDDQSPAFYAATYVQLDGVSSSDSYDMLGGHFRGGQSYTRTTKLVTGSVSTGGPASGSLQRCAIATGLAYFPYDQGWKAGYFDDSQFSTGLVDQNNSSLVLGPGTPMWKHGDGWGLFSGAALQGYTNGNAAINYTSASQLLTWVDTTGSGTYSGLAIVKLPGVNSLTDGMLMTVGNDENNSIRGPSANNAALPDGSGWYVAVRDIDTSKTDPTIYATDGGSDAGSSFSFLYIPWNADNLIAGHIRGANGATIKGAGSYSMTRLSTGRYALTIPGKTDTNGTLLLLNSGYLATQPDGLTNVVDNNLLSYEYGGTNTPNNAFIIDSMYIDTTGGGEGVVTPRDGDFNFVWVDFTNPLAPPGTVPPVLSIKTSGANAIVSWTNGPGFILQSTTSLSGTPVWSTVGTANPSTVAMTGPAKFFRVVHP